MKKTGINIAVIITIVIICLCCDSLLIIYYNSQNQKLHSMEKPMDIANEYMQSKYNGHWRKIERVFSARKDRRMGRYVIGRGMENIGSSYFSVPVGENVWSVHCETRIEGFQIITISSAYNSWDTGVGVYVKVYDGDKGYWVDQSFMLEYDDGKYFVKEYELMEEDIPNKAGLEEATGMTIEEILEIAKKQQEDCENMLCEMKEAELIRNKERFFMGLLLVNGTGIGLIIRKRFKEKLPEVSV